jgi:hypothetical protein
VNVGSTRAEEHDNLVISGEAEDTDRILRKMHPVHKRALEVFYLSKKSLPRTLASLCRCSVAQFYRRVRRAEVIFNRLCYPRQHQESTREMPCAA